MRRWLCLLAFLVAVRVLWPGAQTPTYGQDVATVEGQLLVEDGLPRPFTEVFFLPAHAPLPTDPRTALQTLVRLDDQGRFRRDLEPGRYLVAVTNPEIRFTHPDAVLIDVSVFTVAAVPIELHAGLNRIELTVNRASALAPGCRVVITQPLGFPPPPPIALFEADLQPANVVPPAQDVVSGKVRLELRTGSHMSYEITLHGVSASAVAAAYLYRGRPGEPGEIICTLRPDGFTFTTGQMHLLGDDLERGNLFVQVHTHANPDGAARGQLVPAPEAAPGVPSAATFCAGPSRTEGGQIIVFPPDSAVSGRQLQIELPPGMFDLALFASADGRQLVFICHEASRSRLIVELTTGIETLREVGTPEGQDILNQIRARPADAFCVSSVRTEGGQVVIFPRDPADSGGQLRIELPPGTFDLVAAIRVDGLRLVIICHEASRSRLTVELSTGIETQLEVGTPEGEAILNQIRVRPIGAIRPPDTGSAGLR